MKNYESLVDALKDLKTRGYTQYFEMEYFTDLLWFTGYTIYP